ncbi:nucleolin-like isoform X3 [Argonauta hians]
MTPRKNKKPIKPTKPVEPEESSEDSSESEMEVEAPTTKAKKLQKKKQLAAKKLAESSESEEEESCEEEESDCSEDEDDDEDDEKEEKLQRKNFDDKKNKLKMSVAVSESSDSDEEDSSEEEDEQESSEDDTLNSKTIGRSDKAADGPKATKKRKKTTNNVKDAKKAKVDEPVTVLCRNVPQDVSIEKFEKFLNKKGIAFTAVRKRDDRMFAHIDLTNPDDLDTILAMKKLKYKGSSLLFEKGRPLGAAKPKRSKEDDSKSMFVKNLSFNDSKDIIRSNLMEIFPDARNVRIPVKGSSHRGFAYIEFESSEEVKDAVQCKQGIECGDRKLFLDYAEGSSQKKRGSRNDEPEESTVLLLRNLSYESTEDSLQSYFKEAVDVRIPIFSDSQKPKGIAFVEFESVSKARSALSKYDGTTIDGRAVRCCFARSRGDGGGRRRGNSRRRGYEGRRSGGRRNGGGYGGRRSGFGGFRKKKSFNDSD